MSEASELPIELDVSSVKQLLDEGTIVLIDCREQDEYETAQIAGSMLLPMSQWNEVSNQLVEFNDRRLVVHCHHGMRSLRVTRWLRENGFANAQSMMGGIAAWSEQVDSSVPRY